MEKEKVHLFNYSPFLSPSRRGFSLIEVVIGTLIFALASTIFLNFSSNTLNLYTHYQKRNQFILASSVVFTEGRGGELDQLLSTFPINNDTLRQQLKKWKIDLKKGEPQTEKVENYLITSQKWKAFNSLHSTTIYRFKVKRDRSGSLLPF
ncbi:MAG: hypothetical protein C6I01_07060 [Epsilonproteobacteria bacterium]|nr:hypothetical protein [Campylobacterota bacterium]NPA89197.1 prepilin-type N-terminal cleavage/methylation domain-containing protein [Campylobacterota bacterium]